MRLFDLHCDTFLELHDRALSLAESDLHIDMKKLSGYDASVQIAAVWADTKRDDEDAWTHFLCVADTFASEIARCPCAVQVTDASAIRQAVAEGKNAFILAVEDARILSGALDRVEQMRSRGVRFLTLQWGGVTSIGGAHDTDAPLTDFGRAVVRRCFETGIIPDLSHASRAVTAEVVQMAKEAGKPVVATHSNAYGVYPCTRNLTDREFSDIAALHGLVGISMVPYHLTDVQGGAACTMETLVRHIRHFLSLGGEDVLAMGSDFDGVSSLPDGIEDISSLARLAAFCRRDGISEAQIEKIFFRNAYDFAMRNL